MWKREVQNLKVPVPIALAFGLLIYARFMQKKFWLNR
jgi:hypothetical protein